MARPRKTSRGRVSPGQASYVLERLIGDRRVSWSDIERYTKDMRREIGELEDRLRSLRDAAGEAIRSAVAAVTPGRRGRPPGGGAKRRARITPQQLASRKLQGRYLGLIRQIPATRRGTYQKIAKDKGREAAIKEMQSALNK